MKVLQAIVASGMETLDNRQGFGLVKCSRAIPEHLRQVCRDRGYPEDAREPVLAYWNEDFEGNRWALLNRTVPATDYSGRRSFVSHTLLVRYLDIEAWLNEPSNAYVTPYHVFKQFQWRERWDNDVPAWIDEGDDIELSLHIESDSTMPPLPKKLPCGLLTAFETSNDELLARRVYMKSRGTDPLQLLERFDLAWTTADPFRFRPDIREHLRAPSVKTSAIWQCTFVSNLAGSRPDSYHWAVVSEHGKFPPNREIVSLDASVNDVSEKPALDGLPSSLYERASDPQAWAMQMLVGKLDQSSTQWSENAQALIDDFERELDGVVQEFSRYCSYFEEQSQSDQPRTSDDLPRLRNDQQRQIDDWVSKNLAALGLIETSHAAKIERLHESFRHVARINRLLQELGTNGDNEIRRKTSFPEWRSKIEAAAFQLRWYCSDHLWRTFYEPWDASLRQTQAEIDNRVAFAKDEDQRLKDVARSLDERQQKLDSEIKSLTADRLQNGTGEDAYRQGMQEQVQRSAADRKKAEDGLFLERKRTKMLRILAITVGVFSLMSLAGWIHVFVSKRDALAQKDFDIGNLKSTKRQLAGELKTLRNSSAPENGEPAKAEPAKAEPAKAEPAKAEPAKAEPAKAEPAKGEPAKGEPAKGEPAKGEPAKGEPAKGEPTSNKNLEHER